MYSFFSPIHHFFAPQADLRQFLRALAVLPAIHRYQKGKSVERLEQSISNAFGSDAFLFCTGTDALVATLKTLNLQLEDEVIVPSYTCFSPGGAVTATGGTVVFVEVSNETLGMTLAAIESAITNRTRAIICQHTFGIPSEIKALRDLCDRNGILLIEDCAHMIPDKSGPQEIGKCGHAVILSFGRYKAISGMAGGAVICNDKTLTPKIREMQKCSGRIRKSVIFRLLLYPILFPIARPFIGIGIGTLFLFLCKKFHILLIGSTPDELNWMVGPITYRMPNACAFLALQQWSDLKRINNHRRALTDFYLREAKLNGWRFPSAITENLPLQKFPIFLYGAERMRRMLRKKNIHLYDGCWSRALLTQSNIIASLYLHEDLLNGERGFSALMLPIHSTMTLRQARRLTSEIVSLMRVEEADDSYYQAPIYPTINAYAL